MNRIGKWKIISKLFSNYLKIILEKSISIRDHTVALKTEDVFNNNNND